MLGHWRSNIRLNSVKSILNAAQEILVSLFIFKKKCLLKIYYRIHGIHIGLPKSLFYSLSWTLLPLNKDHSICPTGDT